MLRKFKKQVLGFKLSLIYRLNYHLLSLADNKLVILYHLGLFFIVCIYFWVFTD